MLEKGGDIRKRSMNLVIVVLIPLIDFVVFKIAFSCTVKGSLQNTKFLIKLVFQILVTPWTPCLLTPCLFWVSTFYS